MIDRTECTASSYEVVQRIVYVGEATDGLFFHVNWEELPDKCDWTWNTVDDLYAELPGIFKYFLSKFNVKEENIGFKVKRQLRHN